MGFVLHSAYESLLRYECLNMFGIPNLIHSHAFACRNISDHIASNQINISSHSYHCFEEGKA